MNLIERSIKKNMPKVGIEPVRKQQLIEATLKSIEVNGFQGTTIVTISRLAGMSSGIISHYFGGKQGVIQAAVRHLLEQLQQLGHLQRQQQQLQSQIAVDKPKRDTDLKKTVIKAGVGLKQEQMRQDGESQRNTEDNKVDLIDQLLNAAQQRSNKDAN